VREESESARDVSETEANEPDANQTELEADARERTDESKPHLRRWAHNTLAAEQDFGHDLIRQKQGLSDPRQRGESDARVESPSYALVIED
jgi:hypothetical protein